MKKALREQAIGLRRQGWSYNIICARLEVSKSTLSHWLRDVPYSPNQTVKARISGAVAKSNVVRNQKRLKNIAESREWAVKKLATISDRDLLLLGIGLYIGEGSKLYEDVQFINSDPNIVRLIMRWFTEVLDVPPHHFVASLHIYPDISENIALQYWSSIMRTPLSQFRKTYVDKREGKSIRKKHMLPYGTINIRVRACGNKEFGVQLHRRIMGLIQETYNQTRV